MSYNQGLDIIFIMVLAIIIVGIIYFLIKKSYKVILSKPSPSDLQQEQQFSSIVTQLKNTIDLLDTPILIVMKQDHNIPLSIIKQIRQELPSFANMTSYYVNQYAQSYYQDIILDILRHPLFFQSLEQEHYLSHTNIELQFDLPKPYYFILRLQSLLETPPLDSLVLVTLIDKTEAVSLNKMRSDFIAHASHELRTPLTSLDGFIQTLQSGDVDEPEIQQQFLGIMRSQVNRMIRLTNGLLDLSRVERDDNQSLTQQIDLQETLQQIMLETEMKLNDHSIQLTSDFAVGDRACIIDADRDQIFQIFHNLLDNAVYYTPLGHNKPFNIICRLFFVTENDEWPGTGWVVSIIDNGPGIEKHHIPRLTERFYRADEKHSRTGLGLAIVKHIILRHHGILKITSQVGQGSCFSVWFPEVDQNVKPLH